MGKYHKGIRIEGADEFLLAVNITGHGAPTEDTEAEPGMCYLDEDSEHGDLYKCIGVLVTETRTVYRWKKLAGQEEVERLSEAITDKAEKTLKSADGDSWEVAVESGGDVVTHKTSGTVEVVAESLESATLSDKVLTLTGITGTYGAVIIPDATEISIDVPAYVAENPYFADPAGYQNPSFGWFFLRTDSGYIAVHTTNYAEVYKVSADLKTWSSIGGALANVAQETMRVVLDNGTATVYSDDVATYTVDGITGIGYVASSVKVLTIYGMTVIHRQSVSVPGSADVDIMTGATAETAGTAGMVPAPAAGDNEKVLFGDGTWGDLPGGGGSEETWDFYQKFETEAETSEVIIDAGEGKKFKKAKIYIYTGGAGLSAAAKIKLSANTMLLFNSNGTKMGITPSTINTWGYPVFLLESGAESFPVCLVSVGGINGDAVQAVCMGGVGQNSFYGSQTNPGPWRYLKVHPDGAATFNASVIIYVWGVTV